MRGTSTPTALMVAPVVNGYAPELDKRLPYDPEARRSCWPRPAIRTASRSGMNCPNDRYVNDAEICQAVAAMLARIGVKINLDGRNQGDLLPQGPAARHSFYMLGWTPASLDSHNALFALMATPGDGGQGQFNLGAYSNPRLDELTRKIASENNVAKRQAMIAEAFKIHAEDIGHLPLHQQPLVWGMKKNVEMVQLANNFNPAQVGA